MPERPRELAYLFRIYERVRRRKSSAFGVQPWEWPDMANFLSLNKIDLAPWEMEIIETLDDLYLAGRNGKLTDPEDADG